MHGEKGNRAGNPPPFILLFHLLYHPSLHPSLCAEPCSTCGPSSCTERRSTWKGLALRVHGDLLYAGGPRPACFTKPCSQCGGPRPTCSRRYSLRGGPRPVWMYGAMLLVGGLLDHSWFWVGPRGMLLRAKPRYRRQR